MKLLFLSNLVLLGGIQNIGESEIGKFTEDEYNIWKSELKISLNVISLH